MIKILYAILYSFSANLDNIAIGLSYGIKKAKIPAKKNVIIAIFTCIITFLAMNIGKYVSGFIPVSISNFFGSFILIFIGISYFLKDIKKNKKKVFDDKTPNTIDIKDITTIITILSLNNIATGIVASISGINIEITTIFTFFFSTAFIYLGNIIGIKSIKNKFIDKYSNIISSLILIFIGIVTLKRT